MERILLAGKQYGLKAKSTCQPVFGNGGIRKVAELGAISVDHLEEICEEDIEVLKHLNVCLLFCPAALILSIFHMQIPEMINAGHRWHLASDFNPELLPMEIRVVFSLACIKMRLHQKKPLTPLLSML